jgi:hypothetical protein
VRIRAGGFFRFRARAWQAEMGVEEDFLQVSCENRGSPLAYAASSMTFVKKILLATRRPRAEMNGDMQ